MDRAGNGRPDPQGLRYHSHVLVARRGFGDAGRGDRQPRFPARREAPAGGARHRPRHDLLPHERARPRLTAAERLDGCHPAGGHQCHPGLVKAATWGARKVWKDGYRYSKAGVITVDLVPLAPRRGRSSVDWTAERRSADGRHGLLQPAMGPWRRGAGHCRRRPEADLVDQVRDAIAPLHDPGGRAAGCAGSMTTVAGLPMSHDGPRT